MLTFVAVTSRREFEVEAQNWEKAVHRAQSVLRNEDLLILGLKSHIDINYSEGQLKAKR